MNLEEPRRPWLTREAVTALRLACDDLEAAWSEADQLRFWLKQAQERAAKEEAEADVMRRKNAALVDRNAAFELDKRAALEAARACCHILAGAGLLKPDQLVLWPKINEAVAELAARAALDAAALHRAERRLKWYQRAWRRRLR